MVCAGMEKIAWIRITMCGRQNDRFCGKDRQACEKFVGR